MITNTKLDPIETASVDELQALQTQRLKWTLKHAYENVPMYRRKFDAAGVHPDDFRELSDLNNSINSLNVSVRLTLTIKRSCRATDWQKMRWLSASLMKALGLWLTKWIATS